MRINALLLIAALLLKSVAGFAMAGCHAGHHPAEPVAEQLSADVPATGLFAAASVIPSSESTLAESTASPIASVCSLCAHCCVTTTPVSNTSSNQPPPFAEQIQSPDFIDQSVFLSLSTQPPKPV